MLLIVRIGMSEPGFRVVELVEAIENPSHFLKRECYNKNLHFLQLELRFELADFSAYLDRYCPIGIQ